MKKLISIFILSLLFINTKADTHYINSGNFYYSPSSLTVDVNDTVVWLNVQGFHNVNFDISSTTAQITHYRTSKAIKVLGISNVKNERVAAIQR